MASIIAENEDIGYDLHLQSLEALSVKKGSPMEGTRHVSIVDSVAVIGLVGPIYPRANMMTSSGATSIQQYTTDFLKAFNDEAVRAIVHDIDSPGGDVRGIGDASDIMFEAAQSGKKPIYSFANGYMASAAYYVGAGANKIFGSKSGMIGSIGTVLTAFKKPDGMIEFVSSISPNKRPDPNTKEGKATLQEQVDDLGQQFKEDVMRYRGITEEKFKDYGQGAMKFGPRAASVGLIDEVSTLGHVVEEAARAGSKHSTPLKDRGAAAGVGAFHKPLDPKALLHFTDSERAEVLENMGFSTFLNKWKNDAKGTVVEDAAQEDSAVEDSADESNAEQGLTDNADTQITATREELEDKFSDRAELFASDMIIGNKIYPAFAAQAASEMLNAAIDDAIMGSEVTFVNSEGQLAKGTREAAVRARYESMPTHTLTQKSIKAVQEGKVKATVLAESDKDAKDEEDNAPVSEERKAQLLNLTSQGQAVLAKSK